MANTPIPVADLPKVTPGTLDSVVGVDESTGQPVRFGTNELPVSASASAAIAALGDRLNVIEAGQSAGMLGFATKAAMDADLAHDAGTLALVTNDPTPANNGTYRKSGASGSGSWVQSADRVTGLEVDVAVMQDEVSALNIVRDMSVVLVPQDTAIPDDMVYTGADLLGLKAVTKNPFPALVGDGGLALFPRQSALAQNAAGDAVSANGDPVGVAYDLLTGHSITAPADASRPAFGISGASRYLRFDGVDDRLAFPAAAINHSAFTIVASAAWHAGGNYPTIVGDSSITSGVFLGFTSDGRPRAAVVIGGSIKVVTSTARADGERVTLSARFDGATLKLYVNGALAGQVAAVGTVDAGVQPLICYSGANVVRSPLDLYGLILSRQALSDSDRAALESLVGGDSDSVAITRTVAAEIDAANSALAGAVAASDEVTSAIATAEASAIEAAINAVGNIYGLTPINLATTKAYAIGDSTIAAYAGGTAVIDLVGTVRTKQNVAVPGHTIAQQLSAWNALTIVPSSVGWVGIQIGLNDLDPAEAASVAIARLQNLVNKVRADIGERRIILLSQMIPCRQRLIDIYGSTNGPIAHQKWVAMNAAIAGIGPSPITGVNVRVTSHVALLDDGAGNLKATYDTGDHIHPNTAGRQIYADAWAAALARIGIPV